MKNITTLLLIVVYVIGCKSDNNLNKSNKYSFQLLSSDKTGFKFSNLLDEQNMKNPFNYINAYMGGGVAIGDINNDGLQDVFMGANMSSSKLFLNKGNMKFEDVTVKAKVETKDWCTAVTIWLILTMMVG